ncbi:MAG TPA: alanine--tRNA ligase [Candidatus Limnocylindrales bacterium]|nr:alanine--tRNA ligase [Candidatus Limnocylindrales bacterium]
MSTPASSDSDIPFLTGAEIRARFVEFFAERGHTVVPSASLVPAGDATLLFTNSGMVQFKDALTGVEKRDYVRAVDYQRCLRVAGKHNDFEEVGRTPRHHTLFEMLGNWSFGDYFKREAIHWAWDFLTRDLRIPADRLAATVYTTDDVAYGIWRDEIGLPPERLVRWGDFPNGDEANWWRMGDLGPSGPCSELHYDRGAHLAEGPECVPDHSEHCPRWLEIWNLVFMEFELHMDRSLTPLPAPGVDTGLGLERVASVVQGVTNNYDTDLFLPILARMRELLGHDPDHFEQERFSYQVIADHARAVTFLVADGVQPANDGRGYVLRRIMRRAIRHGRLLGRREPFLGETAKVVIDTMGEAYPLLAEQRDLILSVIEREERQFNRTLEAGVGILEDALAPLTSEERVVARSAESLAPDAPLLPGEVAFRLHDTYGFPIDLTVELAAEYGVRTDLDGFAEALTEQRERSRANTKAGLTDAAIIASRYAEILGRTAPTAFTGYEATSADARVVAIVRDGVEFGSLEAVAEVELRAEAAARAEIVFDTTPFYAESGGQVADTGVVRRVDGTVLFVVDDVQRLAGTQTAGLTVHRGILHGAVAVGDVLRAEVDAERRAHTMRNHTGTHLLHRALRNIVGERARQAGSLVSPESLRFDFPFERGLTEDEKTAIERQVREVVRDDRPVAIEWMTMAEAQAAGADAFFDEKYGERVRTIRVKGFSHELCGGTHCRASGQIGNFIITSEKSIGSGMRRIEAVTGAAADALMEARFATLDRTVAAVGARGPAAVEERIAALQDELRETRRRLKAGAAEGGRPKPAELAEKAESIAEGVAFVGAVLDLESIEALKGFARDTRAHLPSGVIAVGLDADEPQLFVTVSDDLVARGIAAGPLVQAGVTSIDGRGGGRPEMAQGKGTRREGLEDAIAAVRAAAASRVTGA